MTKHIFKISAALALILTSPVQAQHMLNVRDADIRAFIQDAARVTGRTFIIDQRVQGKVSVVTDRPLSKSEYFEIFLSTLRANGLVAVPAPGGAYRILPADTAAAQPSRIGGASAARNQFVTEVIRLRSIDAASALETLRPLVSKEGSITANRAGNSIVVADFADNVARIRQLVRQIDQDGASAQIVTLKNAGAREIATSLQTLVGQGQQGGAGYAVSVVPIDSSNSIALRGDPATVSRLIAMAKELDQQAASGTEIRVYWLEHADAEKLVPVLQQMLGQQTTQMASGSSAPSFMNSAAATSTGGNGQIGGANPSSAAPALASAVASSAGIASRGPAVVTRYEGANAIIIAANNDVQRMLGEVIRQIDTRREQVLIEAIIVEISDTVAKKLGVQWLVGGKQGGFVTNYSNTAPNIITVGGALIADRIGSTTTTTTTTSTTTTSGLRDDLVEAGLAAVQSANGGLFGMAADLGNGNVLGAILNAVKSDTNSNVLSTPWIYTLDNQEAKILVGQEIPVTTGEALSDNFDNAFRTVQRENVGIQLEVKPQINTGGAIKLFLRQEVSSISGPVSEKSSDLILNKREIDTTITVDDGEIVALGGLLDDNQRKTVEQVPLLSSIPGLGELFKSRSKSRTKTNLMIFIRPTIVRSKEESRQLAAQRYNYIRAQQLLKDPKSEPSIDELVRDYMGAVPPTAAQHQPSDQVIDGRVIVPEVRESQSVVKPQLVPSGKAEPQ
ncbi:type II secretion system secretin GspD [Rhizorhapis suberifaciens]|uniref:General secretion pathway protein D n=1 Tax=Rhizorhapis suberifaciens TaxID=13656 RepID=A0A840HTZ2_9SPHN|nr:type II secretion system secretin GspD [Rhizorhapis suberifaciens]MBB4641028.1 general secretion pathway protein D [Rhizorhapis suberifaciens]